MSFGDLIGAVIEEGLTALSLSRKDTSPGRRHPAGMVRLRQLLLRTASIAIIVAGLFWMVAVAGGATIRHAAALAGWWAFGGAVSFGAHRP